MSLKKNVLANYLGQGWTALMGIAFVPLYIKVMGVETYGLIGVFAVLQAWMTLLDMGLTPTLNREMAKLRAGSHTPESIGDLLRSLEIIYIALALLVITTVWFGASWLAQGWLKTEHLSPELVTQSIQIMAFVLAMRWLEQVYRGVLQGLQDQVWLNTMQAVLATLRWGGAYVVIAYFWSSVTMFFVWQGAVSLVTTAILVHRSYRLLPKPSRPARFSKTALHEISRFATGIFLGTALSLLLTTADKMVISKLLSLEQMGYYMLAATMAGGLLQLILPMNTAVSPKFTELVARNALDELATTYQSACEWLSAIIIAPALLMVFFPTHVLMAWSGDLHLAQSVSTILALLSLGTLCNGFMNLPYMLQLAHGWTRLSIQINIVAVALIIPSIMWAVPRYGVVGAAGAWLILNATYVLLIAHFMHRKILPASKWPWYLHAVGLPLIACAAVGAILQHLLPEPASRLGSVGVVFIAGPCLMLSAICALPRVRQRMLKTLRNSNQQEHR
jgi:O-antigen/teichoic acid export membrane protein